MATNYDNFESIVDYNTVLDDFEGPLDLLLHLINIAQINIEDVFVSKVTEQFLDYIEYMKTMPSRDVDKESEYLAIAAQIIYIKSKSLVPVEEDEEEYQPDEDELAFIEQLKQREYELIKEETPKLKSLETIGYVFKEPDKSLDEVRVVYRDFEFTLDELLKTFARIMMRNESLIRERANVKEIPKDEYSVHDKVVFIRDRLAEEKQVSFESLFKTFSRNEVVTTFQAILEMLKLQYIQVVQADTFGNIDIKLNPDWDLKEISYDRFDEYN